MLLDRERPGAAAARPGPGRPVKGGVVGDPRRGHGAGRDQRGSRPPRAAARRRGSSTVEIGPCVWVQHAKFDFGGYHFDQDEWIHVAWCAAGGELDARGLEALEALAFDGWRWWPLDELLASCRAVLPVRLRELLPPLIVGDLPDPPLDIGGGAGAARSDEGPGTKRAPAVLDGASSTEVSSMALFSHKIEMVSPERALPGRAATMPVARGALRQRPPVDAAVPGRDGAGRLRLGCFWGAERKFWEAPGRVHDGRRLCGRLHPEPDV